MGQIALQELSNHGEKEKRKQRLAITPRATETEIRKSESVFRVRDPPMSLFKQAFTNVYKSRLASELVVCTRHIRRVERDRETVTQHRSTPDLCLLVWFNPLGMSCADSMHQFAYSGWGNGLGTGPCTYLD